MEVMPGFVAAVGGRFDETDIDSKYTAYREVIEETGINNMDINKLEKFTQSDTCDWYVYIIDFPNTYSFSKAQHEHEVMDIKDHKSILRPLFSPKTKDKKLWEEPFGHLWIRYDNIKQTIKNWKKERDNGCMYGLEKRINNAIEFLENKKINSDS
jgi:8-oxo-dGTP pyrophosphatase MutT (NUDIX family)